MSGKWYANERRVGSSQGEVSSHRVHAMAGGKLQLEVQVPLQMLRCGTAGTLAALVGVSPADCMVRRGGGQAAAVAEPLLHKGLLPDSMVSTQLTARCDVA